MRAALSAALPPGILGIWLAMRPASRAPRPLPKIEPKTASGNPMEPSVMRAASSPLSLRAILQ